MKQHIPVYNVGNLKTDGMINVCNIEEVWLNEESDSVAIRYRSPNGQFIDHEEYYDCTRMARRRFYDIAADLDCGNALSKIQFKKSMKERSQPVKEAK